MNQTLYDSPRQITAETIAAKHAALKNMQTPAFASAVARQPRCIELAWWLQSAFLQPNGAHTVAEKTLNLFSDHVGTAAMHRLGKTDEPYTAAERQEVISGFPAGTKSIEDVESHNVLWQYNKEMRGIRLGRAGEHRPDLAFVNQQNHAYFYGTCRRFALARLPGLLENFCRHPDATIEPVWWFHDLPGALIEVMDAHAAVALQPLAMTTVARQVLDACEFAWSEKALVEIKGDSRFGKTESVKAFRAAYPGRARLVKTPCTNDDRSFFASIAEAVGMEVTAQTTAPALKAKIEFILKHSGLLFCFDESAWLFPQRYTANTTPFRLNYVRSQILENGCPVLLVTTPQFLGPVHRFERCTGFNLNQWRGRIMRTVQLPAELPEEDLLAVARVQCGDLPDVFIRRIVAAALICQDSFLFTVEKIIKNARALARKNSHPQIEFTDLEEGIRFAGLIIPSATVAPAASPPVPARPSHRQPTAASVHHGRTPSAEPLTLPGSREMQPAEIEHLVN